MQQFHKPAYFLPPVMFVSPDKNFRGAIAKNKKKSIPSMQQENFSSP
jgi:hypothetical protein